MKKIRQHKRYQRPCIAVSVTVTGVNWIYSEVNLLGYVVLLPCVDMLAFLLE